MQGVSPATVARNWDAHGLKPYRIETFKLPNDTRFAEKLIDIVWVWLNPRTSRRSCAWMKSRRFRPWTGPIGIADEERPVLDPTHDDRRNGAACLFAALKLLDGIAIGTCYPRHRNTEFLNFLRTIDREMPTRLDLHLILDNCGTHTHPRVRTWLEKDPRFHLHFTPAASSWLKLVGR